MPTADPLGLRRRRRRAFRQGQATWSVRLVLVVVCLIWLVPTIGLFVSSFRTRDA